MTLKELAIIVSENKKIPYTSYSLNGGMPNEALCISKSSGKWNVYYSERGKKSGNIAFETETDACEYFYARLLKMLGLN